MSGKQLAVSIVADDISVKPFVELSDPPLTDYRLPLTCRTLPLTSHSYSCRIILSHRSNAPYDLAKNDTSQTDR